MARACPRVVVRARKIETSHSAIFKMCCPAGIENGVQSTETPAQAISARLKPTIGCEKAWLIRRHMPSGGSSIAASTKETIATG